MLAAELRSATLSRQALWIGVGCAALAALSLLALPAVTAPDPNAWLTWSKALLDGDGIDFAHGPAWKPLPVLITLPLGVPGKGFAAMSWLWLVRFTLLWASGALYLLVRREAGLLAGLVAAVLPFTIRPWLNVGIAGESETIALALVLTAGLTHLGGRRSWTVALLTLAGLSRPEVWPLLVLYALWRWRGGDRKVAVETAGAFGLFVLFWIVGPKVLAIGSDSPFTMSGGHSLHNASWRTILDNSLGVLPPKAWVFIPIGLVGAWFASKKLILVLAAGSLLLVIEIALLWALHPPISATGYTPVLRYFAAAGVLACGVAGYGAEYLRDIFPEGIGRWIGSLGVVLIVAWSITAAVPGARSSVDRSRSIAASTDGAVAAINASGGVERLRPCFPFTVSNFSAIAWDIARRLGVPLQEATTRPHAPSVAIDFVAGNWVLATQPPKIASGRKVLGRANGWQVVYYPGLTGCLKAPVR